MSTMHYSSSDGEEDVRKSVTMKKSDKGNAVTTTGGGVSPMVLGAGIVGVIGVVVGIGARFILKSRKNASTEKFNAGKNARLVPGPRKVPPRRPRSVASSVDGGSQTKRYGYCRLSSGNSGRFILSTRIDGCDLLSRVTMVDCVV